MNLKYILVITFLCLLNTFSFSQQRTVYRTEAANKKVSQANYLIQDNEGNTTFIRFDKDTRLSQISDYKSTFHLQDKSDLILKKEYVDALGIRHIKYEQTYNGVRIVGGEIVLHSKNDFVTKANGKLIDTLSVDTNPKLSESEALNIALQAIGAKVYKWQVEEEELLIKNISNDNSATYYPNGELIITSKEYSTENSYQLAYLFDVHTVEPLGRIRIEIDAHTGKIINQFDQIHHTKVDGSGESLYNDEVEIKLDYDGTNYNLSDATRGNGIFTYDLNNGTSYGYAKMISESDNYIDESRNKAGVSAHFAAAATYDYYFNKFGRNSFDGEGSAIKSYVHYSNNYFNAFWNGSVMTYGDGNGVTTFPLVTLDIVGHEITHAVTQYSADLVYAYESGALNESFSDIFGQSIEFATAPETASWNLGDQVYADGVSMIRSMSNPKSQGDPSTYKGQYWVNGNAVHTNSGVMNYWYYLLVEGGTGTNDNGYDYDVNGIGLEDAQQIAYRNLTVYLTENSQYMDARVGAEEAAIDLFGENSTQHLAVVEAWNAVGVPSADPLLVVDSDLGFGDVPVGFTQDLELTISNQGNALLNISSITVDNPIFSIADSSFSVEVSNSATIKVSFTPTNETSYEGEITINSNGGDNIVNLSAVGVEPPVISVTPESLSESLYTGETATQNITIDNSAGGSDLQVEIAISSIDSFSYTFAPSNLISVENSLTSDNHTTIVPQKAEDDEVNILVIQNETAWGVDISNFIKTNFNIVSSVISYTAIESENFSEYDLIITAGDQFSSYYQAISNYKDKFEEFASSGGSILYLLGTQGSNVSIVGDVEVLYGNKDKVNLVIDEDHPIAEGLSTQITAEYPNHNYLTNLPYNADTIIATQSGGYPTFAVYKYGAGLVVASGTTIEFLYNYQSLPLLGNTIQYALNNLSGKWLSVEETNFTIPAGGSKEIPVTFDATGLNGATYTATIALENNDPFNPSIAIPVTLDVTGAPDIVVSQLSIDFGAQYIGAVVKDTITISNVGTDVLSISNISVSDSDFSVEDGFSTEIAPGDSTYITIQFAPSLTDSLNATLKIESDDNDEGTVLVSLAGKGITPPVIVVNPKSLSESLYTGETSTQSLTIDNSAGGGDLNLSIDIISDTSKISFVKPIKQYGDMESVSSQSESNQLSSITPSFAGDQLSFNISTYGEIMPYQYPIGTEHLQSGNYVSGYTVAYEIDGVDKISVASYYFRTSITQVSYTEIVNDDTQLIVEVVTKTSDGAFEITRVFTHEKSSSHIKINTTLLNTSGKTISNVVLKSYADWDVERGTSDNNWGVDPETGLVYVYKNTYHSISSKQLPDFQDIDGWDDYKRRQTDENLFGDVYNFDGLQLLHFELGTFESGTSEDITTAFASASSLDELLDNQSKIFNSWFSVAERNITIPAGGSKEIPVTFDATGLNGGNYTTTLALESNDPLNPSINIPVSLKVTGAPEIDVNPLSIEFGTHYIGTTVTDSILISNTGNDVLSISSISVSNADFSIEEGYTTEISPEEAAYISIQYTPTIADSLNAILTIESNDADEGTVLVNLIGKGIEPPVITVNTNSLSESLFEEEKSTQIITIDNSVGGSDLQVEIQINRQDTFSYSFAPSNLASIESSSISSSYTSIVSQKIDNEDVNILVIQNRDAWGIDISQFIETNFNIQSSVIGYSDIGSEDFSTYDLIITAGNQNSYYYQAISNYKDKFEEFAYNGGRIVYFLATLGSKVSIVGDVEVIYGHLENDNLINEYHPIVEGLGTEINGNYANHTYLYNLPYYADTILSTKSSGNPTLAVYKFGSGHVLATGMTVEHLYNYHSVPLLGNIIQYELNKLSMKWLSVDETKLTIPAGASKEVAVTFDATDLEGDSTYFASLVLESNDVLNPSINLPVTLKVKERGAYIALSSRDIDFGTHLIGDIVKDTILISNTGTDSLFISDISVSDSAFTLEGELPTALAAGEETYLAISFTANKLGEFSAKLSIESNDMEEEKSLVDLRIAITPEAPTVLSAVAVSQTQIDLLWDAVAEAEAYEILSSNSETGPFTIIATIYAPNTTFSHSGLSANQTVYYQVRARLSNIVSSFITTSATTFELEEVDTPTGLSVAVLSATENKISWDAPLKAVDRYILERAKAVSGPFTMIAELTGNTTSFYDSELTTGQINFYRLKAKLGSQESDYTQVVSLVTSINELSNNVLMVYPNPTNNGKVTLDAGSEVLSNARITLYNSTGNVVYTKVYKSVNGAISIDFGKMSTGMYLMDLVSDKFFATKKIIIR